VPPFGYYIPHATIVRGKSIAVLHGIKLNRLTLFLKFILFLIIRKYRFSFDPADDNVMQRARGVYS
jgi:hypothetical protein